jgi:hypothetical protein
MTTEAVIATCADAGVAVSVPQLARWVRAGLIPAHLRQRHSRGRGKGIEWLWQPECVSRAIIIARSVQVGEGSDPSLLRAALSLALFGHDLAAEPLRDLLLRGMSEFGLSPQKPQPQLQAGGATEAPERIRRRFLRQFPTAPESTIQVLTAVEISRQSLRRSWVSEVRADDAAVLSIPRLRTGLLAADDTTLLTAYAQAKLFAPLFGRLESFLMMMQEALLAAAPTFDGRIEERLLFALPPVARIALMRLILTAVLAAHPELLRADSGDLQERTQSLFQVMTDMLPGAGLSQYAGAWQVDDVRAEVTGGKELPTA